MCRMMFLCQGKVHATRPSYAMAFVQGQHCSRQERLHYSILGDLHSSRQEGRHACAAAFAMQVCEPAQPLSCRQSLRICDANVQPFAEQLVPEDPLSSRLPTAQHPASRRWTARARLPQGRARLGCSCTSSSGPACPPRLHAGSARVAPPQSTHAARRRR